MIKNSDAEFWELAARARTIIQMMELMLKEQRSMIVETERKVNYFKDTFKITL